MVDLQREAWAAFPCPGSAHPVERPPSPVSWVRFAAPVMDSASELLRVVTRSRAFARELPCPEVSAPRRTVLRSVRSGAPVQGFHPSAKRYLLVAGHCLLAVDSAPLTGFRQLPRKLRVDFEALILAEIARPAPVLPGVGLASPLQASSRVSSSPLPVCRPILEGSKPFAVLRWRGGLLRVSTGGGQHRAARRFRE
jgi:hypothetical protein